MALTHVQAKMEELTPIGTLLVQYFTDRAPGGSNYKNSACNAGDPSQLLGWEDPPEKGMATHSNVNI